jgi:2,2-dialkylglycine decarboxylase (pyruvate)
MLLIFDEAQTGFGRLGAMFGFDLYGIAPDILSVSKTLGGGIPIAATLTSSAIEEDCYSKGFMHVTSSCL